MDIKFHKRIKLDSSLMIAGWPGMGNVAVDAVNYVRRKLNARFFGEINTQRDYIPEGVIVDKGSISFPDPPSTLFHYRKHPPVTFLEGTSPFQGQEASQILKGVLDVAQQVNTEAIITSAAFPVAMNHQDPSEIYFAANSASLSRDFKKMGLAPLKAGQISGLNGMILGYAKKKGIEAACLLATIPQYTLGIPNPRAVMEVADVIGHLLDEEIDLTELEAAAEEMDKKLDSVESSMRNFIPGAEIEDGHTPGREEVPGVIIEKIEKLFEEAKSSRQKAVLLKEELDRWDIYSLYEDRFLDLFRKSH